MNEDDLPLPKPVLMAIAAFAAIVLLAALVWTVLHVGKQDSLDSQLKAGATRALPTLRLSGKGYGSEPTFYRLYQRFVYDERAALVKQTIHTFRSGQWAQVLVVDTQSSPPQSVLLNVPGHDAVPLDAVTVNKTLQHHTAQFTTVTVKGESIRAYLTPVALPSIFRGYSVTAVLEVLQKK